MSLAERIARLPEPMRVHLNAASARLGEIFNDVAEDEVTLLEKLAAGECPTGCGKGYVAESSERPGSYVCARCKWTTSVA